MGRSRKMLWPAVGAVVTFVVALDQATKAWALRALHGEPPRTVIPGFFDFTFGRNTGGVFGILSGEPSLGRRIFFTVATAAALAVVAGLLRHWGRESRLLAAGLALVAGGAVGNLIDRLRYGSVIDFIDWYWRGHHWPTFNIADSAISIGAALLLAHALFPARSGVAADPPEGS